MIAGKLPDHHGIRDLTPATKRFGVQIDRSIFVFELEAVGNVDHIDVGGLQLAELHSSNLGGIRVRFELVPDAKESDFQLSFVRLDC